MAEEKPPLPPGMVFPPPQPKQAEPLAANQLPPLPPPPVTVPPLPVQPGAITSEPLPMPPIALNPVKTPAPSTANSKLPKKEPENKDSIRELMETVVFVVVLVLMLKTFLAEAFVIPTGSMADTLMGYHYKRPCDQCGYLNLVNASSEAEPQQNGAGFPVMSCQCQNCGWTNVIRAPQMPQGVRP